MVSSSGPEAPRASSGVPYGTLKNELIYHYRYSSREEAIKACPDGLRGDEYIEQYCRIYLLTYLVMIEAELYSVKRAYGDGRNNTYRW
jgi:hypothetical protein